MDKRADIEILPADKLSNQTYENGKTV